MRKALLTAIIISALLASLVAGVLPSLANANPMPQNLEYIYIGTDGNVQPSTVPIQRFGDTYTLTANISKYTLAIQRDNIIVDGAGYSLSSDNKSGPAILIGGRNNVTIKNIQFKSFCVSYIQIGGSSHLTITENTIVTDHGGAMTINGANYSEITNNTIYSGGTGEVLFCSGTFNTFSGNSFFGGGIGINLYGTDNTIVFNNFVDVGVAVYNQGQNPNTIENNNITNSQTTVPSPSPSSSLTPSPSIPEFPTWIILSVLAVATLLAVIVVRSREKSRFFR